MTTTRQHLHARRRALQRASGSLPLLYQTEAGPLAVAGRSVARRGRFLSHPIDRPAQTASHEVSFPFSARWPRCAVRCRQQSGRSRFGVGVREPPEATPEPISKDARPCGFSLAPSIAGHRGLIKACPASMALLGFLALRSLAPAAGCRSVAASSDPPAVGRTSSPEPVFRQEIGRRVHLLHTPFSVTERSITDVQISFWAFAPAAVRTGRELKPATADPALGLASFRSSDTVQGCARAGSTPPGPSISGIPLPVPFRSWGSWPILEMAQCRVSRWRSSRLPSLQRL